MSTSFPSHEVSYTVEIAPIMARKRRQLNLMRFLDGKPGEEGLVPFFIVYIKNSLISILPKS